jgi:hypothetical protein
MSDLVVRIEGQTWVTFEAISECYQCDVAWVRQAYEFGLFGRARTHAGMLVLRATVLDRVANAWRLSRYEGRSFDAIVVLLGDFHDDIDDEEGRR